MSILITASASYTGQPQGLCDTTMTPRFFNEHCKCPTYPENLGPCENWEKGGNGRCVYCDHAVECHISLVQFGGPRFK